MELSELLVFFSLKWLDPINSCLSQVQTCHKLTACDECGRKVSRSAKSCPGCGSNLKRKRRLGCLGNLAKGFFLFWAVGMLGALWARSCNPTLHAPVTKKNLTKASESSYNQNILEATTSRNLSNADLAWHAKNTYAWSCSEVIARSETIQDEYFIITCANGTELRVYPRAGKHPKIKNIDGTYK